MTKTRALSPRKGQQATGRIRFLGVIAVIVILSVYANGIIPEPERQALIDLYTSTNGDGWYDRTNWLGERGSECQWFGVVCDDNEEHVIEIDLFDNGLTGELPSTLNRLSRLERLVLLGNALSGSIPPTLFNLKNLTYLHLGHNDLSGEIPTTIGNMSALVRLSLYDNHLTGPIPTQIGQLSNLARLYMSHNSLTGAIPSEIGHLTQLRDLSLGANSLVGELPAQMINLQRLFFNSGHNYGLYLNYNGLYTPDPVLLDFLNQRHFKNDLLETQTIPPGNLRWVFWPQPGLNKPSGSLSWDVIRFNEGPGEYRILFCYDPAGPYYLLHCTPDKLVSTLDEICLEMGQDLRFVVQTVTYPHTSNVNWVISDWSEPLAVSVSGTAGDLDDNGRIDGEDVRFLSEYLAENLLSPGPCIGMGNLDHDGAIDLLDVMLLRLQVASQTSHQPLTAVIQPK